MVRLRANAIIGPPTGRARSNAVDHGDAFFLTAEQGDLLAECRTLGIRRGIEYLSMLTVDWEEMLWEAAGTGAGMAADKMSFGVDAPETKQPLMGKGLQDVAADKAGEKVKGFLSKVLDKAKDRIVGNAWATRAMRLMGLGVEFLVGALKRVLLSKEVIKGFIPFYDQIKGVLDTVDRGVDAYRLKGSVANLQANAELIGSGIPSVAMAGFTSYLNTEMAESAGLAVYNFGKTLAKTIVQILTAGASTILNVVMTVVELVVSWVHKLYQAWMFNGACLRCREWRRSGAGVEDFTAEFSAVMGSCPLLGAFFFSVADHIGTINLTTMFAKKMSVVPSNSVDAAGAKVWETQVLACKYLARVRFKPKFREAHDAERYGHLLSGIDKVAAAGTPPADRKPGKLARLYKGIRGLFG